MKKKEEEEERERVWERNNCRLIFSIYNFCFQLWNCPARNAYWANILIIIYWSHCFFYLKSIWNKIGWKSTNFKCNEEKKLVNCSNKRNTNTHNNKCIGLIESKVNNVSTNYRWSFSFCSMFVKRLAANCISILYICL